MVVQRHLGVGEAAVKVPLLLLGQGETKVFPGFEDVVQVLDSGPEFQEEIVLGDLVLVGERAEPDEFSLQAVEREAAEQAVLGIRDEIENLIRGAGEQRGQFGLLNEHTLAVLASGERDVFVVKRLAEAVGILAVVGGEDVGEGVAFAFEHHPAAAVVVQDLIDHRGGTVGRDVVHQHRRFLGDFKSSLVLGGLVFLHLLFVLLFLLVASLMQVIVDCLREVATERKTPLACGSTGGDEQEEVGVHSPSVIYTGDVRKARGKDAKSTEDKHIAVFVRGGLGRDGIERCGETVSDSRGEDGERLVPIVIRRFLRRIRSFRNMRRRCVCGFRVFCGSCVFPLMRTERDARFLRLVEEGVEGHARSVRPETLVVLLVGFALVVFRMEPAHAVEVVTTVLTEFVGEGESDVAPVVITRGDVYVTCFESLQNDFDIIGPVAGIDDRG